MLGLDLSSRGVESHSGSIRPPRRWHAHAIPSWTRRIGRPVCGLTWWAGCDSGLRHVRSAYTHTPSFSTALHIGSYLLGSFTKPRINSHNTPLKRTTHYRTPPLLSGSLPCAPSLPPPHPRSWCLLGHVLPEFETGPRAGSWQASHRYATAATPPLCRNCAWLMLISQHRC